jgi:hypothetical protein
MHVIREPDYLQVVDELNQLQALSHIQVDSESSHTQVGGESSHTQVAYEPTYLQVVDEAEQHVVGTTSAISGENVSRVDNDGYMQPVDSSGYLKPVDVMHNSDQHYQTPTTSTGYQVRHYESFNQTLNSVVQTISADVANEPRDHECTNQLSTSGCAVPGRLYDAESSTAVSAQDIISSQGETPTNDSAQSVMYSHTPPTNSTQGVMYGHTPPANSAQGVMYGHTPPANSAQGVMYGHNHQPTVHKRMVSVIKRASLITLETTMK